MKENNMKTETIFAPTYNLYVSLIEDVNNFGE